MKKMALISLAFLVALLLSYSAEAKPVKPPVVNEGTFCTDSFEGCNGYFTTKFWKEKFFGGGPGEPGNVLMAIGQGFTLQNVVLQEPGPELCTAENCAFTEPDHPCLLGGWNYLYKTTYKGGFLRLNKGPQKGLNKGETKGLWLRKGKLKDSTELTATNYSAHNADGSLAHFCLVIEGEFDNAPYSYDIVATFDVEPDNYQFKIDGEGNPVFQRGYDFDAMITIGPPLALPE